MNKSNYYEIIGIDKKFFSLRDAKNYIFFNFDEESRNCLDGRSIVKYMNGEPMTEVQIIIRGNKYAYSKPRRL